MNDLTTSCKHVPAQRHAEAWTFLIEAVRDIRTTGAIAPSSRRLARSLVEPLREQAGRRLTVLEAGAGTGAVTRALIPLLSTGSHLDIVEANAVFAGRLCRLVRAHPLLADCPERVRVHHTPVEELVTDRRYDVIVSGLPFTNFAPGQVETIMCRYRELLRPGGVLTYFAYLGSGPLRALAASRAEVRRHRAVQAVLARQRGRYTTGCRTVWGNLPPARVWRLRAHAAEPAVCDSCPDTVGTAQ
ncbi:class I SAM-dependent methyltransferase [Streptomyces sp. NPDC058964]|uniref:class I SAM-dependent methyltransferase n=1 Tax=Streptomyces sp. NPDC058964 TaxID=3346681 RepID=UPI0036CA8177